MKAVVVTRPGGPEVLEVRECPTQARPGEVIVRVEAVGVNFADTMSTRGSYRAPHRRRSSRAANLPALWKTTGERVMGYMQYGAAAEKIARQAQNAVAAAQGLDFRPVSGFPGQLPYRLPGVLESRMTADAIEPIHVADHTNAAY